MNRILVLIISLALVACSNKGPSPIPGPSYASIPERTNVGNGGSDVLKSFIESAEKLLTSVQFSRAARAALKRHGIELDRLKARWSPNKVTVTRKSPEDHRGSAVDGLVTGGIELYETTWAEYFRIKRDLRVLVLHELLRLYTDSGETAIDDGYEISRDVVAVLQRTEIAYTITGEGGDEWYHSNLFVGESGCRASLVQAHLNVGKSLHLTFTNFDVQPELLSWLPKRFRPSVAYRASCELTLLLGAPLDRDLVLKNVMVVGSDKDDDYRVEVITRTNAGEDRTESPMNIRPAFVRGTRVRPGVSEISLRFRLFADIEATRSFSIEKIVIPLK